MPRRVSLCRWDELALEKITEMVSRRVITATRQTLAQVIFKKGALVPQHRHDSEQVTSVLDGALRFSIAGGGALEDVIVRAGEVIVIPPGVPHQVEALDDTLVVDTFSPGRADW
jgi:quercetin dioxygenase-like cupin family protein